MAAGKITWDTTGTRKYEMGTAKGVLYTKTKDDGKFYGVAWNGLTAVTESPEGADLTDLYADDIKYASLRSTETFKGTIEAYTYPDEFMKCDGSAEVIPGITIGQQSRERFCFSYQTREGSDNESTDNHYKIHVIYNCTASPSQKSYATINENPDAITFSWEISSDPVQCTYNSKTYKPVSTMVFDSVELGSAKMAALEKILYGADAVSGQSAAATEAYCPDPADLLAAIAAVTSGT